MIKNGGLTFIDDRGRVSGWGLNEVELRQLHVRGYVDPSAFGPPVKHVILGVAD